MSQVTAAKRRSSLRFKDMPKRRKCVTNGGAAKGGARTLIADNKKKLDDLRPKLPSAIPASYNEIGDFNDITTEEFREKILPHENQVDMASMVTVSDHNICFPPEMMYKREKKNSILETITKEKGLESEEDVMSFLRRCRSSIFEDSLYRKKLMRELTPLFPSTKRSSLIRSIQRLCRRIFETKINIMEHREWGDALLVVDYSEGFGDDYLFNDPKLERDEDGIRNRLHLYHSSMKEEKGTPKLWTLMENSMQFINDGKAAEDHPKTVGANSEIVLSCYRERWKHFCNITKEVLLRVGMDESMVLELLDGAGFLRTRQENPQSPHCDFRSDTMMRYLYNHNNSRDMVNDHYDMVYPRIEKGDLPYSADIPLTQGGLRLQVWGPENGFQFRHRLPFVLNVRMGMVAFWRADVIHGGCLSDRVKGGGFRMHCYIPLNENQKSMSRTHSPEIEWNARCNGAFTSLFCDLYGRTFT